MSTFNILDALNNADFSKNVGGGTTGGGKKIYSFNFENVRIIDEFIRKFGFSILSGNGNGSDTAIRRKIRTIVEHCVREKKHVLFLTKIYFVLFNHQDFTPSSVCSESNTAYKSIAKFLDECKQLHESKEFNEKFQITRLGDIVKEEKKETISPITSIVDELPSIGKKK